MSSAMPAGTPVGSATPPAVLPSPPRDAPGGPSVQSRRTARGDRTRARILDAARIAFRGVGWHRARVEDVCRVAGIGHGTYYAYFGNKAAVLEALVRLHATSLYELADAPWTSGDVRHDVRGVIDGFVGLSESDSDIRAIWFSAAPSEPRLAALVDEVRQQFVARVRHNLVAAAEAGLARPGLDIDVAAIALAAMVEQTVTLSGTMDTSTTGGIGRERVVGTLTDLWVAAVYE